MAFASIVKNLVICISFRARKPIVYGGSATHTERILIFEGRAISGDPFLVNDREILEPCQKRMKAIAMKMQHILLYLFEIPVEPTCALRTG